MTQTLLTIHFASLFAALFWPAGTISLSKAYLSLDQFCASAATDRDVPKKRRQRHQLALAFGRDAPIAPGRWRPLDVVAFCLTDRIEGVGGLKIAARIVREFWYIWLDAVRNWEWQVAALSDSTEEPQPIVFYVGKRLIQRDAYYVTYGLLSQIVGDLGSLTEGLPHPAVYVSIWDVLTGIRQRARAAGIPLLDEPFVPRRDDPDQAGLQRLLAGIKEANAVHKQMGDPVTRRRAIAVGQRTERVWLQ